MRTCVADAVVRDGKDGSPCRVDTSRDVVSESFGETRGDARVWARRLLVTRWRLVVCGTWLRARGVAGTSEGCCGVVVTEAGQETAAVLPGPRSDVMERQREFR